MTAIEKANRYVSELPLYQEASRDRQKEIYNNIVKSYEKDQFCEDYNIKKEIGSTTVYYCGQEIEFNSGADADNFIADMYEAAMCCNEKW